MTDAALPSRPAIKPVWIHDLLILWRRNQSRDLLLERAGDYVAQEIRSAAVRRAVLAQIAAHFVETTGSGRAARTTQQNVWATYSRNFPPAAMASAYLVQLVAGWPLAYVLAASLRDHLTPGEAPDVGLLTQESGLEPDSVYLADLDACLRTLHYFGVLAVRRNVGRYLFAGRVPVPPSIFPLLVWSWWQQQGVATIDLAEFTRSPLFTFVDSADFPAGWAAAADRLWTLDAAGQRARLHPHDRADFVRALLNLLSTDGRRGRNLPRDGDPSEDEPPQSTARQGRAKPRRRGPQPMYTGS